MCWLIIAVSLRHSIKHYCPRNRGFFNRLIGLIRYTPLRFLILLPLALCVVAYQILCSFSFAYSPLNVSTDLAAMYAGGYTPAFLIVVVNAVWGLIAPNEDRELIRQRRTRGSQIDSELGLVQKPAWWRRAAGEGNPAGEAMRDRIARNVREIGGGRATAANIDRRVELQQQSADADANAVEMASLRGTDSAADGTTKEYLSNSDRRRNERAVQLAAGLLFPNGNNGSSATAAVERIAYLTGEGPPPYSGSADSNNNRGRADSRGDGGRPGTAGRSNSTETTNSVSQPPQQVRSMLDV